MPRSNEAHEAKEARRALAALVLARIRQLPPDASPSEAADAVAGVVLARLHHVLTALEFYRDAGRAELAEDGGHRARVALRVTPSDRGKAGPPGPGDRGQARGGPDDVVG